MTVIAEPVLADIYLEKSRSKLAVPTVFSKLLALLAQVSYIGVRAGIFKSQAAAAE